MLLNVSTERKSYCLPLSEMKKMDKEIPLLGIMVVVYRYTGSYSSEYTIMKLVKEEERIYFHSDNARVDPKLVTHWCFY